MGLRQNSRGHQPAQVRSAYQSFVPIRHHHAKRNDGLPEREKAGRFTLPAPQGGKRPMSRKPEPARSGDAPGVQLTTSIAGTPSHWFAGAY